jgi:hypothetical protein
VGVDETRHHGGATRVDDRVGVLVEAPPDARDEAVTQDEGIGIEERPPDVAADQSADVTDERFQERPRLN